MFPLTNKPAIGARLYSGLIALASDAQRGTDVMKLIQYMAGVLVETYFVFEDPDEVLNVSFRRLAKMLGADPVLGDLGADVLPPAHIVDRETERGREVARDLFVEWMDCEFEFHEMILGVTQTMIMSWEEDGLPRGESLRLLIECALRCMAFEISAQELCDVVIDENVASQGWSINDCIAGLSAIAGVRLATSMHENGFGFVQAVDADHLDQLTFVMTAEAVRLGVPAGSDWRLGLPANDVPANAPYALIAGLEPMCASFFETINLECEYDQAVACAKAAGRMLAVAAGGENPEIEPAIAKPLAMAAVTESYKSLCTEQQMTAY